MIVSAVVYFWVFSILLVHVSVFMSIPESLIIQPFIFTKKSGQRQCLPGSASSASLPGFDIRTVLVSFVLVFGVLALVSSLSTWPWTWFC